MLVLLQRCVTSKKGGASQCSVYSNIFVFFEYLSACNACARQLVKSVFITSCLTLLAIDLCDLRAILLRS